MASKGSLNTYCLLNMKMNEVEKSNKKKVKMETSKKDQNSTTNDSKPTPDVIILEEPEPEKKNNSRSISPVNEKQIPPVDKKETPSGTKKQKVDPNVPVFTYGDFYCTLCDAHMNSEDMWMSHVIGKRHKKNLNKGTQESKYEDLDVKSNVEYELRNVKDAIVGLSYIQETRRREVGVPPLYACFLCQSNFATVPMVIDHLISVKHRLNYIKENSNEDYQLLDAANLKKPHIIPLVTEMAVKLEEEFGRGTVIVKQEKPKEPYVPTKQFSRFEDDIERTHKSQKHSDVWKPVGNPKDKFQENFKDCRLIIEEKRRQAAISVEKTGHSHSNHYKRHRSPSPYSQESYKRERIYSRNRYSPNDDYRSYSRSPPRESPRNNSHSSRKDVYDDGFHSSPPPRESPRNNSHSSRKDVYDGGFHSRSSQLEQKDISSSKKYSFLETENKQPNSSDSDPLKQFCVKLYALPTELFLKLANLKLELLQVKGADDLSALVKTRNKAQSVFYKNFPSDLKTILGEKLQKTESSPNIINQDAASSSEKRLDLSFFSELTNKAEGMCLPSSSNVKSDLNSSPLYGSTFSYSNASSTMAPSGIPGQSSGHRQPHSTYNTAQSQYSDSTSSNYPEYKYF